MAKRWRAAIPVLVGLLLTSIVSPFSYLPNPPGLYHLLVGGYHFDPRSPFVNRFATLGTPDPTAHLTAQLDRLLGLTGLDPLDPVQPLVGYRVREIITGPTPWTDAEYAEATVEFRYASGATRSYRIPVWQYGMRYDGSRTTGWRYTGLDRLFAAHLPLPHLAPADDSAPRLGIARPLADLPDLGTPATVGWTSGVFGPQHTLRPSPDGRSALIQLRNSAPGGALWVVPFAGTPARLVADHSRDAAWAADGRLVFLRCPGNCTFDGKIELVVDDPTTGGEREPGRVAAGALAVAGETAYLLGSGALWRVSLSGGEVAQMAAIPPVGAWPALAVTPDGERIAHTCGDDVCLADATGAALARVGLGYPPGGSARMLPPPIGASALPAAVNPSIIATDRTSTLASLSLAWSPDGSRLAIAVGTYPGGDRGPELWIVDRAGRAQHRLPIGPNGWTDEPVWTPDGRSLLLTTFPGGGRRIVAIDAATGAVADLSQPRWDAFATLAPDGAGVLLWNGRGDLWVADLKRRAGQR